MARRNRACPAGIAQHLIQRGSNRQPCFGATEDFAAYAHWQREASERFEVSVHAWVFMTNHVHLLATPERPDGISRMMQHLGRLYVRYFNHQYGRSGTLWEGRFKSCLVQDSFSSGDGIPISCRERCAVLLPECVAPIWIFGVCLLS
ncbi:MAG: transposase [Halofilum sp. (in: g-proteobacteria)]|nr:transposase [Halofilum sp. (in: g-proteobacteria)]